MPYEKKIIIVYVLVSLIPHFFQVRDFDGAIASLRTPVGKHDTDPLASGDVSKLSRVPRTETRGSSSVRRIDAKSRSPLTVS